MQNTPSLTSSLTMRGLAVAVLAFFISRLAPSIPIENAQQIADALATILFAGGASLSAFGYARRAYAPPTPAGAEALGLFGRNGWQDFAREIARMAAVAAIEAMMRRDEVQPLAADTSAASASA